MSLFMHKDTDEIKATLDADREVIDAQFSHIVKSVEVYNEDDSSQEAFISLVETLFMP